jgi:protein arginine kinase activator
MLCEKCGQNQASVRIVQVENGQKSEVNLCQACAQGFGAGFAAGFDLQNILANMFDLPKVWGAVSAPDQRRCPTCKSSLVDIQKRAQLGCSECYTVFENELDALLRRIHSTNRHVGKIPATGYAKVRMQRQIEDLRRKMEECVRSERFEEAAEYRDEVRRLEKQLAEGEESSEQH